MPSLNKDGGIRKCSCWFYYYFNLVFVIYLQCVFVHACPHAGRFYFSAETASVNEKPGPNVVAITIRRSNSFTAGEYIKISTQEIGSATAGQDFTEFTGGALQVVFQDGEAQKTIDITILDDQYYEDIEKFRVYMHSPGPTGEPCTEIGYPNNMTISIIDDSDISVSFGSDVFSTFEGEQFNVNGSAKYHQDFSLAYAQVAVQIKPKTAVEVVQEDIDIRSAYQELVFHGNYTPIEWEQSITVTIQF